MIVREEMSTSSSLSSQARNLADGPELGEAYQLASPSRSRSGSSVVIATR